MLWHHEIAWEFWCLRHRYDWHLSVWGNCRKSNRLSNYNLNEAAPHFKVTVSLIMWDERELRQLITFVVIPQLITREADVQEVEVKSLHFINQRITDTPQWTKDRTSPAANVHAACFSDYFKKNPSFELKMSMIWETYLWPMHIVDMMIAWCLNIFTWNSYINSEAVVFMNIYILLLVFLWLFQDMHIKCKVKQLQTCLCLHVHKTQEGSVQQLPAWTL